MPPRHGGDDVSHQLGVMQTPLPPKYKKNTPKTHSHHTRCVDPLVIYVPGRSSSIAWEHQPCSSLQLPSRLDCSGYVFTQHLDTPQHQCTYLDAQPLQGLSWRVLASDPVRSVSTSAVTQQAGSCISYTLLESISSTCAARIQPNTYSTYLTYILLPRFPTPCFPALLGKDIIDETIPNDPNDAILTSLRGALHQIRECTRALRTMDIPWDTTNSKAVEKFAKDFEAIRVKVEGCRKGAVESSLHCKHMHHTSSPL